jgi:hypothetical protein
MSEPTPTPKLKSMYAAITMVESRLDACPAATVTPQLRAALDRLLVFPVEAPFPALDSYEPGYASAEKARSAWFDRNLWVMENFVLSFVGDCAAKGPVPDPLWLETLHDSMRDYLRIWLRAYAIEQGAAGFGVAIGDLSLLRLVAMFQLAQSVVEPDDLSYRPHPVDHLYAATARYASV